ncbi:hypothetical protein M2447_002477 [Ereboglobus sp. PH5-10]|uniref:alginate lyase family protein n=1 Tax=Ereboglobus sp. PH5-10 TaxID=2940629 RepID=UPI0024053039|nr:alginate lyase family protein [Ereboglobus sp. PH5-10]MDF9828359.1 hypothetical protein [Ereboglobus sp. PH5-10]
MNTTDRLRRATLAVAAILFPLAALANSVPPPAIFCCDPAVLANARERAHANDPAFRPAYDRVLREADKALALKPLSVIDKKLTADSGDKHDYLSLAPYWWPDPAKPDGLPYIRRDGQVNPESKRDNDALKFVRICTAVKTLGLAYYLTGRETYAETAALLTRVWFLDEATRMNPNLNHAQGIRGRNSGRGAGVLEGRHITALTDGLALIAASSAWPAEKQTAMRAWLESYHTWLTTSKIGLAEAAAANNHGTWYAVQAAHLELALGKTAAARRRVEKQLPHYIATQIEPDGRQPHELARTNSLHYSIFNLEPLFELAQLGERAGYTGGWAHTTKDGRSLRAALAYVAPYLDPAKPWPKKDITPGKTARILPLLRAYLARQDDAQFKALYETYSVSTPDLAKERWHLLLPPLPR